MSKKLEEFADSIRSDLTVPRQSEVFAHAVEAAYLAAMADGNVDDEERRVMVRAVELLSQGVVLEWEVETLLEQCAARANADGAETRSDAVGSALKDLGQAEAGIMVAAFVARATNGVEKSEAEVIKAIGKAAGLNATQVKNAVKKATGLDA